jgi:hypothetical protein
VRPFVLHPFPFPWRVTLSSIFSLALLQLPGTETPDMTFADIWEGGGFMMWFLALPSSWAWP